MQDTVKLTIELPRIPDIELVAIEGLDRLASHMGIAEEKTAEARILVTEAVINALEHSGEGNPVVKVEYTMSREEIVIFVRDFGTGFDPTSIPEPGAGGGKSLPQQRGWGLKLMKSMSDDFRIESTSDGTKITLLKKLT
jgi:anti-sigma regulatory factor (Ser/Thr protein kinase)